MEAGSRILRLDSMRGYTVVAKTRGENTLVVSPGRAPGPCPPGAAGLGSRAWAMAR